MLARNCDFSAEACSRAMCERRSSSFWRTSSEVASRTLFSSSADAFFSSSYRRARSNSSVRSCRIVTTAVTSPCSDTILPEIASIGSEAKVVGSTRLMPPVRRRESPSKNRLETNEEKWASLACTWRCASSLSTSGRATNSRSAGAFIITMLPPGSVTRIGSATESMTRSSRSRSARASASVCRSLR